MSYPGDKTITLGDRTYLVDPSERKQFILDVIDYALWSIEIYEHFYTTGDESFHPLPNTPWRKRMGINEPLDIFPEYKRLYA